MASRTLTITHNGTTYWGDAATIKSTILGYEEHGIMSAYLELSGEGWGVLYGGYALDAWNQDEGKRLGIGFGVEVIEKFMWVAGVRKWEDLKGKTVILLRDNENPYGGSNLGLAHPLEDRVYIPAEHFSEWKARQ